MQVTIEEIRSKNTWGKNELTELLTKRVNKYTELITNERAKGEKRDLAKIIKFLVIKDSLGWLIVHIQSKASWGKNVILEKLFSIVAEQLEDVYN